MRSLELANIFIKSDKAEKSSSIWEKFWIPIKGKWKKVKIEIASLHLIKIVWKKNTKFHRELVIKTSNWIVWNEDQMIQQVFSKRLTKDVLTAKKTLVKLWRLDWQVNSDKKDCDWGDFVFASSLDHLLALLVYQWVKEAFFHLLLQTHFLLRRNKKHNFNRAYTQKVGPITLIRLMSAHYNNGWVDGLTT